MSRENVELLRRAIDAHNARDIEAFVRYCDPRIEFESAFAAVGGATYRGHDGLRRGHRDVEDVWGDDIRIEPETFFDLGDRVLAYYVVRGRGKHSGVEVAMPVALWARWRDGLIVFMKGHAHREDALSDLGVSDDELESIVP